MKTTQESKFRRKN